MEPSFSLPPLEFCLGVSPNHAAKSRPVLNTLGSGTLDAITDAISTPMPGISSSRRLVGFCLCALAISSPTASIDWSRPSRCWARPATADLAICGSSASDCASAKSSSTRPMPLATMMPNSARWPRSALTLMVRCLTNISRGLVQHQHGLLIRTLDRHETHARPRHRLADRRRVDRVILAPLDVGLDVSRRYQHHFVPHRHELAGPIMSGTARLHTDPARLDLLVKLSHLRSLHLTRDRLAAFILQAVNLKIGLAKINRCSDKLLHGRFPSVVLRRPRFGTRCRLSEAVHTIIARSAATKQSILSLRGDGLLRFARNDGGGLFHAASRPPRHCEE